MIQKFVDRLMAKEQGLREGFRAKQPESYKDIVEAVVRAIVDDEDSYEEPDPSRIVEIDHGHYQGTLLYVVGANSYQPSLYWYVFVGYGSCSGCDTLESIRSDASYDDDGTAQATDDQLRRYWHLAVNVVQGIKEMDRGW